MNDQIIKVTDDLYNKFEPEISKVADEGKELNVNRLLTERMFDIVRLAQTSLSDGKLTLPELLRLVAAVSTAFADAELFESGKKEQNLKLVREVMQELVETFVTDPTGVADILMQAKNLDAIITVVYHLQVKRNGFRPIP